MRLAAVIAGLLGCTLALQAQEVDPVFLDSLWSVHGRLMRGVTGGTESANFTPDPHEYVFEFEALSGLDLSRNFTREAVAHEYLPLAVGFRETTSSKVTWAPSAKTQLNFTSETSGTRDLTDALLNATEVRTMGLQQGFGGGSSATTLGFRRQTTVKAQDLGPDDKATLTQYSLSSDVAKDWAFGMNLTDTEANKSGGLWSRTYSGNITAPLFGNSAKLALSGTRKVLNGVGSKTEKIDFTAPFSVSGGDAIFEHHLDYKRGSSEEKTRLTRLASPLKLQGEKGSLEHKIEAKLKKAQLTEKKTTELIAPFRLWGKTIGHKQSMVKETVDGTRTDTFRTELSVPLNGGTAVLHRQVQSRMDGDEEWKQRRLIIKTPDFRIGDVVKFRADRTTTETVGEEPLQITNMSFNVQPLDPLNLDARWQLKDDKAAGIAVKSRVLHSSWALNDALELKYHFTESEIAEQSPAILRHIELVRNPKKTSGVAVSAGYLTYGAEGVESDPAPMVKLSVGKESAILLSALYTQYDQKKLTVWEEDPVIAVTLKHSSGSDRSVQLKYEDQEGRIDAERGLGVAFGALGGSMFLGYSQNALGRDGKTVRHADVYDAMYEREVLGDLNLQFRLLYCDYLEDGMVDQHYDVKLDGGSEERGGKVALSFASGELVPKLNKGVLLPRSVLNLSYTRKWGDQGRLSLSLQRATSANESPDQEDDVRGNLTYTMDF